MTLPIEDYALIGSTHTAALVGKNGSIDWFCVPRFDSQACFAALLGTPEHGRWQVCPKQKFEATRKYCDDSMVLETTFTTPTGVVRLTDCMAITRDPTIIRRVQGVSGVVEMQTELIIRFEYGSIVPWVRKLDGGLVAIAGPHALQLHSDIALRGKNFKTVGDFTVKANETFSFVMSGYKSHHEPPPKIAHPETVIEETKKWWRDWSTRSTYKGPHKCEVARSLMVLKALTYAPTGGIVAAPTTSLPEDIGGARNWDYRYCWLRDSTFVLYSLMGAGYTEEASAWREWLLRSVAGKPSQINIMYGLSGERRLTELTIDYLPGYEKSKPVRIGNAAHKQFQMDVFGELADALFIAGSLLPPAVTREDSWRLARGMISHLEQKWQKPDEGIWEIRSEPQHFVHSKVMAWVALDRGVKAIEKFKLEGPLARWKTTRDKIRKDIFEKGFDKNQNTFVQHYGSDQVDASLLLLPIVGFIEATDSRMMGTVKAIEEKLLVSGLIRRYLTETPIDGLSGGEGVFLACSFWYVDNLILQGRKDEAEKTFSHLLSLANDLGLLSEEYDVTRKRMCGNFPQAFSHVSLINTAFNLVAHGPAQNRPETETS